MNIAERIQKRTAQLILELKEKATISLQDIHLLEDEVVFRERLSVCYQCEYYDTKKNKCNLCGCNLKMKAKIHLFHCPIKKW